MKIDNTKIYCIRDNNDDMVFVIETRKSLNVENFISCQYYLVDKDINVMPLDETSVLDVFSGQKKIVELNNQLKKDLLKTLNKKIPIDTSYNPKNKSSESENKHMKDLIKYGEDDYNNDKFELLGILENKKNKGRNI